MSMVVVVVVVVAIIIFQARLFLAPAAALLRALASEAARPLHKMAQGLRSHNPLSEKDRAGRHIQPAFQTPERNVLKN